LTLVLVGATIAYVYWTKRLADQTATSVKTTKDVLTDQQNARVSDHAAAVEAVFQELVSIAGPLRLVLEHGELAFRVPFALFAAYREVLGPLYRGLPPNLGQQLAKTYSLLDIQRVAFERLTVNVHQLKLVYNEDLVPTTVALHAHLHELGRDVPAPPNTIPDEDIALAEAMVEAARKKLSP